MTAIIMLKRDNYKHTRTGIGTTKKRPMPGNDYDDGSGQP